MGRRTISDVPPFTNQLAGVIADLRHVYDHMVNGRAQNPVGLAQGLLGPCIGALETVASEMSHRTKGVTVVDAWPLPHEELVALVRADALRRNPAYTATRVSVVFRIERLTGGAQGGARMSCDVEVH